MNRATFTLIPLVLLLLGASLLILADLSKLTHSPEEYQRVYGFTEAESSWSHRSSSNYVIRSLLTTGFLLTGVILALWSLRSEKPIAYRILYVYLALLFGSAVYSFGAWAYRGFDH